MVLHLLKPRIVDPEPPNQYLRYNLGRVLPAQVPNDPVKLFPAPVADFDQDPQASLLGVLSRRRTSGRRRKSGVKEVVLRVEKVLVEAVDHEVEEEAGGDALHVDLELAVHAAAVVHPREHVAQPS